MLVCMTVTGAHGELAPESEAAQSSVVQGC
jgi:hypothetical protein